MQWLLVPFVMVAAALNTVQSGANAQLAKSLGQPWAGAIVVYVVGLVGVAVAMAIAGPGLPSLEKLAQTPWGAWLGGLMGGVYVICMLTAAEPLGAATFSALSVTAGLVTSVALDHFGLVGFKEHPASLWRLVGVAMMIGGVGLVARF